MRPLPRLLLLSACLLGVSLRAAEAMPPEMIRPPEIVTPAAIQTIPAHPRLLADAARWAELRQLVQTSPTHRELYAFLRLSADALLQKPPVDYTPKRPGENILAIIRDAEDRIFTLAMMYRLSGDKQYLDGSLAVMRGLAATSWPEGHFLDPATACGSLAIGYDWLYDELSPAERDTFAAKIKTAGLELTTRNHTQLSFLWADFNWNQICNTGLTLGALAIADREPDLARYVVNRTIAMIPRVAAAYAPDGVYPEGPGYWAYGTSYHVMLIEALRSSLHTSHNLEKFPGFLESASVIDQVTGPSGGYFNYFDTRPGRTNQNLVYWFARETRRPDLATNELARLRQALADGKPKSSVGLAFALLWFPPPTPPASADSARPSAPLHWQGGGHQPVAILRSAWNDPAATWFAIKGGTANYSHGHMDSGSFVLEAGGVRWALDPEIEDYLDVRSRTGLTHGQFFSYAQDSQRWAHFRLGPEGNNLLR
ncbi:MAG: heparinase, partial [Burkholderiales bacterium]|nr:heparinase [Opitutaceae bacterium]